MKNSVRRILDSTVHSSIITVHENNFTVIILPLISETTFSTQLWRFRYRFSQYQATPLDYFVTRKNFWKYTLFYNSVLIEISSILPCTYI
jgi:hypothetical protein